MAFRFALAPLLRLRQSIQRQRALQLQHASFQVFRAEETLTELGRFLSDSAQSDATSLESGRTGAELQFACVLRDNLHNTRGEVQANVRKLETIRLQALGEYHQAYRDREVLDTMRARQRHEYQLEQSRREQRELDAAYLLQHWRHRP
jgi:flagellar export protein FliJ